MKFKKDHVKKVLNEYYDEGIDKLDERIETYNKAIKMYRKEYRNKNLPDDSIYYPLGRNEIAEIQRSMSDTYAQTDDMVSIKPEESDADSFVGFIADAQDKIFNRKLNDKIWYNKQKFLDDATLQAGILGTPHAVAGWKQKFEPVFRDSIETDPVTGQSVSVQVEVGQRLISNLPTIDWLYHEDLIWDSNATVWEKRRWAMRTNIYKTAGEMWGLVDSDDVDPKLITQFLEEKTPGVKANLNREGHKSKWNDLYELRELWGYITLQEHQTKQKFVRILTDSDFEFFFVSSAEDDDKPNMYFDLKGNPMDPFQIGYVIPKIGEPDGESPILSFEELQMEENDRRNAVRVSAQQDTHSIFALRKGSGVDENQLNNRSSGAVIWVDGDPRSYVQEFPHRDTTGSSLNDLELVKQDKHRTFGNTDFNMGISAPSDPETATGQAIMSNSSSGPKFALIKRFGKTFLEPLYSKILAMSIRFTTDEELAEYGIQFPPGIDREVLYRKMNLTINAERGATSKGVKKQQAIENSFLCQQVIMYAAKVGLVITPAMMGAPIHFLKIALENNGEPSSDRYIPDMEEILELSKKRFQQGQKAQKDTAQQQSDIVNRGIANAEQKGADAASQIISQQGGSV